MNTTRSYDVAEFDHPRMEGCIIALTGNVTISGKKRLYQFEAEYLRFDAKIQDNIVLKVETITPEEFSAWWSAIMTAGWRVMEPL